MNDANGYVDAPATDAEMAGAAEAMEDTASSDGGGAAVSQAEFEHVKQERDQLMDLVAKQMEEAMRSLGVVPVETIGTPFNPHQHEALSRVETMEYPDEQVLDEVRRGYKIKERLLRPALVTVAHNAAQHAA